LRGNVFSGKGEGAKFVRLSWARKQMEEKLGFKPYPGTLNIRLDGKSVKMRKALMDAEGEEILSPLGFCRGKIFQASMMNVKCAVVIPEVPGYPEDVLEVVSSTSLREKLHLDDGSMVEVKVTF
jgi:CTP-dependent riboflavin kinase